MKLVKTLLLALVPGLVVGLGCCHAADLTWTNGSDIWQSATAWTTNGTGGTGGFPGSGDDAFFTNAAIYSVTLISDVLNIQSNFFSNASNTTATVTLNLGVYELNPASATKSPGAFNVGDQGTSTTIVYLASSTIPGKGLVVPGRIIVGRSGIGTLFVTNGNVSVATTILANGSGRGTLVVSGPNTVWTNTAGLSIGNNSNSFGSSLVISNSALMNVAGTFSLGSGPSNGGSSNNTLLLDSSARLFTQTGPVTIGNYGTTTSVSPSHNNVATVQGGAVWDNGNATFAIGYAAGEGEATGNVLTVGAGGAVVNISQLTITASNTLNLAGGLIDATTTCDGALQGFGTILGDVTIADAGFLSPANSLGQLTFSNSLTLASEATTTVQLGTNFNTTVVIGNLTLGGTLNINDAGGITNGTYTLFTYGGSLSYQGWTIGSVPNTNFTYTINTNSVAQVDLVVGCGGPHTITTSSSPAGGGTTSGDSTVNCGSNATVCATPNPCFSLANWTDQNSNVVSTSACYTLTATSNETLTANFTPATYIITTSSSPAGGGTTSGGGTVNCGSNVTVCATPNPGYGFVNWTENGNPVSTSLCYFFTVETNRNLVANLSQQTAAIIGVSGNLAFGNVTTGTTATATMVITNSGNATLTVSSIGYPTGFSGPWSGTIPSGGSQNVTVSFAPTVVTSYVGTITVTSDATSGTNTISASGIGTVTPPNIPDACWSGTWVGTYSDPASGGNCTWTNAGTITFALSVTNGVVSGTGSQDGVTCIDLDTCTITGYGTMAGALTGTVSGTKMNLYGSWLNSCNGMLYQVAFGPNLRGCTLKSTHETLEKQGSCDSCVVSQQTAVITVQANPSSGGNVSGGGMVNYGSNVTVCATPNSCYSFVNWTDQNSNVVSTSACYTFTATSNETLVANFTAPQCDSWAEKAPMPTGRNNLGVGVVNGILYVAGGDEGDSQIRVATVVSYNPVSDTWATNASMSIARWRFGVGVVNGTLYAAGGYPYSGYDDVTGTVEAYDPGSNTWTPKAPMLTPRGAFGVGVIQGILYTVGGATSHNAFSTVEAYDPVANAWTTKAPMPTARSGLGVAVINGILYAVGGDATGNMNYSAANEAYDPISNSWSAKAPLPVAMVVEAAALNGILYVTGYAYDGTVRMYAYNPATDAWTTIAPMPTPRSGLGLGVVNGSIFAVGGNNWFSAQIPAFAANEAFTACPTITVQANPSNAGIVSGGGTYNPCSNATVCATANSCYSFVNWTDQNSNVVSTSACYTFTVTSNETLVANFTPASRWTAVASLPIACGGSAAGAVNDILYIAGGHAANGPLSQMLAYNPLSNTWTSLASMPGLRYQGAGMGVISNQLYIPGGWTVSPPLPNNNLWVYDPGANTWAAKASMPRLSGDGVCGVISNKLYVYTPNAGYSELDRYLDVYDPALNSWATLTESSIYHSGAAGGVINGKLYMVGGYNGTAVTNVMEIYDPAANTWVTSPTPLPTAIAYACGAVLNGRLYIIGGADAAGTILNTVEIFDPTSGTWTTGAPMPTARSSAAAAVVKGVIYVVGGGNSSGNLTTVEAYQPVASTITVQANPSNAGIVSGGGIYNPCSNATVCATANSCYSFVNWTDQNSNVVSTSACYTFTVTSDETLVANFTNSTTDSVGDGILDCWRQQFFGGDGTSTNAASCGTCDSDGTGQNNLFKYLAGLNPTNPASVLRVTSVVRQGNDVCVTWTSVGGHSYVLQSTKSAAIASYNTNFADASPVVTVPGAGESTTNFLNAGVAYAPVLTAPGGTMVTTSVVPSTVDCSAAGTRGITDSLGRALPIGSLLVLGTFSISEPTIQSNFFAGNVSAIMSNFTPYTTSFKVGDGTGLPASWGVTRGAAGFDGQQIYLLAIDKPTFAAATHLGIFTAPSWVFPSGGGTSTIDLEDVTRFVIGAQGGSLTINLPLGEETYTFSDTARLNVLPGRILFYRVRLVP